MKRLLLLFGLLAVAVVVLAQEEIPPPDGPIGANLANRLTYINWQMVGPGAGGAFNNALETTDGVLMVGGDVGGGFRSVNRGFSWWPIGKLNSAWTTTGGAASTIYGVSTIFDRTNISAMASDSRADTAVFYAGIEGGLLRSVDGGRTFATRMCDSTSGTDWIQSVATAATSGHQDTVLCAWAKTFSDSTGNCIRYNVARGNVDSTYSGQTQLWRRVATNGMNTRDLRIIKIACKPNNAQFIYALSGTDGMVDISYLGGTGTNTVLYRLWRKRGSSGTANTNFLGGVWEDISPGTEADSVWDFALDPYHPDTVFATTWTGSFRAGTHTGNTWVRVHQDSAWRPISAHTGAVFVGGHKRDGAAVKAPTVYTVDVKRDYAPACTECGVWKASLSTQQNAEPVSDGPFTRLSTGLWDSGWQFMQKWAYSASERGVCNTISVSQYDTTAFYWTTSQYVFKGDTLGAFSNVFTDFRRSGPAAGNDYWKGRSIGNTIPIAASAAPGLLAIGWWDLGIGLSRDGGKTWQMSNDSAMTAGAGGWLGHGGDCSSILIDPQRPSTVWAGQGTGKTSQKIIRSTTSGTPGGWSTVLATTGFVSGLSVDLKSAVGSRILFATSNGDLYRSSDNGSNWTLEWDRASGSIDSCLRFTAVAGPHVWVGGAAGLWHANTSTWAGTEADSALFTKQFPMPSAWAYSSTGTNSYDLRYRGVHDLSVQPNGDVFVTIAGTSSGNPNYVNAAGDSFGVYRSRDNGTTWTKVHAGGYDDHFHVSGDGAWWITSRSVGAGGGLASGEGLWRSKDQGRSWVQVATGMPWPSTSVMTSDPVNAEWIIVTALGPGVFRAELPGIGYVPRKKGR